MKDSTDEFGPKKKERNVLMSTIYMYSRKCESFLFVDVRLKKKKKRKAKNTTRCAKQCAAWNLNSCEARFNCMNLKVREMSGQQH